MRKTVWGPIRWGIALIGAVVISMPSWAQSEAPEKLDSPALAQSVYEQTVVRLHARDRLLPQDNGFTSLAPMCGEALPRNIESIVPRLQQAAARKRFDYVFPWKVGGMNDATPPAPVLRFLRGVTRGLRASGSSYESVGDRQKACERYLLGLELSSKWGKTGPLGNRLASAGCLNENALPFLRLLGYNKLPAAYYRQVGQRVQAFPLAPSDLLDGLDESYVMGIQFLDAVQSGKLSTQDLVTSYSEAGVELSDGQRELLRSPDFVAGEKARLQNMHLRRRPYFEKLENLPASALRAEEAELERAQSLLARDRRPIPICVTFRNSLTHLSAIRLLAALQAYHGERQSYPSKLDMLIPGYLKRLPTNYMSGDGTFRYVQTGIAFKLESTSALYPRVSLPENMSYYPLSFRY